MTHSQAYFWPKYGCFFVVVTLNGGGGGRRLRPPLDPPLLCTYRLEWARTSRDHESDINDLQTQGSSPESSAHHYNVPLDQHDQLLLTLEALNVLKTTMVLLTL